MEIKRLFALVAMIFISLLPVAGEGLRPYFCDTPNTTLEYVRTTVDGDIKWYHTMKIGEVNHVSDSVKICYTSHILNNKFKPYYGDEPAELSALLQGGNTTLNVAQSVGAVFKTILPKGAKIVTTGGESTLPADMSPGDTLPDVYASVKAFGLTMRITVTQRRVLRYETIKTPAGEFDCIVVRERKVERGMGRNRHTVADTWYARGIGMIRHDTHDKNLELQTSEFLFKMF